MKKVLLSIFAAVISLPIAAQESEKPLVYDYEATKHEIAIDIVPLLGGDLPLSFFYRKNYLSPQGKQRGFRVGLAATNQFNPVDVVIDNTNFTKEAILNYFISVGKEWQKPVLHNFIGYTGADFGVGLFSQRFSGVEGPRPGPGETESVRVQSLNYSLTYFWGVKYHILPRLSVFAEMGIAANYLDNRTFEKKNFFDARSERIDSFDNFSLNLLPLRALRVAYHF